MWCVIDYKRSFYIEIWLTTINQLHILLYIFTQLFLKVSKSGVDVALSLHTIDFFLIFYPQVFCIHCSSIGFAGLITFSQIFSFHKSSVPPKIIFVGQSCIDLDNLAKSEKVCKIQKKFKNSQTSYFSDFSNLSRLLTRHSLIQLHFSWFHMREVTLDLNGEKGSYSTKSNNCNTNCIYNKYLNHCEYESFYIFSEGVYNLLNKMQIFSRWLRPDTTCYY